MNEQISAQEIRLIDEKGAQLGLIPLAEALERASRNNLDLVEVAPDSAPPVCKIMDFRRHTFESKRRQKEQRKKTKSLEMKEFRLRPNIDKHDLGIKLDRAQKFLIKGHKVKFTMRYRPSEMRHYEIGTNVLKTISDAMEDLAAVDHGARGKYIMRTQTMVLAPKKK